jgi:hypothetical protein
MQAVFGDDRLDLGPFGDLMDQGVVVLPVQRVTTAPAGVGLAVSAGAEFLGRDQGSKRLEMAGLSTSFSPGRRSRWLSFQADRIRGRRLGRVGGIELEPSLEIAHRGFQLGDPILQGFPGSQEGGLGFRRHGVSERFRDRKVLVHIQ